MAADLDAKVVRVQVRERGALMIECADRNAEELNSDLVGEDGILLGSVGPSMARVSISRLLRRKRKY